MPTSRISFQAIKKTSNGDREHVEVGSAELAARGVRMAVATIGRLLLLAVFASLMGVRKVAGQTETPTATPTPTGTFNGTTEPTPTPTPTETPVGACNRGGGRGWLEMVTDGFHPILPFGPSGLHGRTYGEEVPNSNVTITVTELSEIDVSPEAECCPQRYYPERLYRITLDCPISCAFLMSVEFNDSDLSLGTDSFVDQLGTWSQISLDSDPQVLKFVGAKDYNSVASVGQLSSSLSRSYSVLWSAPPWERVGHSELQVRATVVLDLDVECPGYFVTEQLPALIQCGDTYKDVLEACDDGNLVDGDGCDSSCEIEVGWTCDGRETHPSTGFVMSACTKAAINVFPQHLTMEEGTTAEYSFNLTTYVTSQIFLQLINPSPSQLAVVGLQIFIISPEDWNQTRTVTLEVLENSRKEGNRSLALSHDVTGNDPNWDLPLGSIPDVVINITDNDEVGLLFSRSNINMLELGDTASYSIALRSQPVGFVQVSIRSEPADFGFLVSPAALLFNADNWDEPQEIVMQVPDNNDITGQVSVVLLHEVESVSDMLYNFNETLYTVNVTVEDNDSAGIRVLPRNVAITEAGAGANYTITLLSQPAFGFTVVVHTNATCASQFANDCKLSALNSDGEPRAVLGRSNWDSGVVMTVRNLDNSFADGHRVGTVAHTVESSDPSYSALQSQSSQAPWAVAVEVTDDDLAAIFYPESLQLREGGPSVTFSLSLSTKPYAAVNVALALSDDTWLSMSPTSVTWTPEQWRESRNISVISVTNDQIYRGPISADIVMSSVSADESYNELLQMQIPVTLVDDDAAGVDLGIDSSTPIELAEGALTRILNVRLTSRPLSDVRLVFTSGTQINISPAEMRFSSADYAVPQSLRVLAVDDVEVEEAEHFDSIRIQLESADLGYNSLDLLQVVRITDNDLSRVSKPVDRWGGQICPTSPCGETTLTVPPMAIEEGQRVGLTVAVAAGRPAAGVAVPVQGSNALRVSSIASFEPHNTSFSRAVFVTVAYDEVAAASNPEYQLAFFRKSDPLSVGWQRQEAGTFDSGIAILPSDHLSLYFVGIIPKNTPYAPDDGALDVLECPEDEVDTQTFATALALGVILGGELLVLMLSGLRYCIRARAYVIPSPYSTPDMRMIEPPPEDTNKKPLQLKGPESEFDYSYIGPPPPSEDRPKMVTLGKQGPNAADGPSVRGEAALQK